MLTFFVETPFGSAVHFEQNQLKLFSRTANQLVKVEAAAWDEKGEKSFRASDLLIHYKLSQLVR